MYTMIARALPFHSQDRKKTFKLIKEADPDVSGEIWLKYSSSCKDLMLKMLIKDPKERITVQEALEHPWLSLYKNHLMEIKKQYHPVLDISTGTLRRPSISGRRLSVIDSSALNKLALNQESVTDYAQMVEEGRVTKIKPNESSGMRAGIITESMVRQHHLDKIESQDSLDNLGDVKKLEGVRRDRLGEMRSMFKQPKALGV